MRTIFTYYRNFLIPATGVTLASAYLLLTYGRTSIPTLFWLKVVTASLFGLFYHLFRADHLAFYHNLGYSTARLYTLTATMDMGIWLVVIILTAWFV